MLRMRNLDGSRLGAAVGAAAALVCGWSLIEQPACGDDAATVLRHGAGGVQMAMERRAGEASAPASLAAPADWVRGDEVLWHNYLTDAMYTTSGISVAHGSLVAGTCLNPPLEAQLIPLEGTGTPDWTYPGNTWHVAASRNADVIAAADFDGADSVTVYVWQADSGTPVWSRVITTATLASQRAVAVSPDGSTIAVLVNETANRGYAQLYLFEPSSAVPLVVIDCEENTFARNLAISENGAYVAFIAAANIYVVDRDAGVLRYSGSAGASNDPMAISGDGQYIAYGWLSLYVRQWNGSTYSLLFTRSVSGYYLAQCAIASGADTLVTAWYRPNFMQNTVELHDLPSSTPLWTYTYDYGAGEYQDLVYDMAITADGGYFAAASLGDQVNTNPEVHVFEHDSPTPVLTVDTPGSMFDVDIATAAGGAVYLSACGKHVHANEMGRGGDLYSVLVATGCPADVNGDGTVDIDDLFDVLSHWGEGAGTYDVNDDGTVDIDDIFAILADWGPC